MSEIVKMTALTMSSREIAELTGKRHDHVLRDVRVLQEQLGSMFGGSPQDWVHPQNGQTYEEFVLDKDTCLTLLLGYDAVARMKVVKRWQALEAESEKPALNPANLTRLQLIQLAMEAEQEKLVLEAKVQEQAPKVEVHDRIADAEGSITIRETANTLRVPERKFVLWLQQNNWCYRRAGHKSLLGYADKVKAGYLYLKQTPVRDIHTGEERLSEQVRVTPLGLTVLARRLKVEADSGAVPGAVVAAGQGTGMEARV